MSRLLSVFVCASALNAVAIHAQAQTEDRTPPAQPQSTQSQASSPSPSPPDSTAIDPTKLGISFDRVRMQLTAPASNSTGLKIQETIEVVGKAPTTLIWNPKTVNLTSAAVPFGAPTQKDIQKLIVPKEFQNYPFDLNALMQWLMEHLNKQAE